jgi:hypothetical protein
MQNTNIVVTAVMIVAVVSGIINAFPNSQTNKYLSGIISSIHNKDFIKASGQYGGTPFVTVAVESYTTNHLPNITGTCSLGDVMTFTIKKGTTNLVSETISKPCDASPYALNPTITLPDGKYRVDVTLNVPQN